MLLRKGLKTFRTSFFDVSLNMIYLAERITMDPDVCGGKPVVNGHRITVQTILGYLSVGETKETILDQFPYLESEDIDACLKFAHDLLDNKFEIKPLYG